MNRPHRGKHKLYVRIIRALNRSPLLSYDDLMRATEATRGTLHVTIHRLRKQNVVGVLSAGTHHAEVYLK